ncbi:MAG TPA: Cdc6/Cdc18 family protein [Thermoplasmata archaeon]|nr:Cdc6/Cdc18 family protein [Thermoplasmata archaeon]
MARVIVREETFDPSFVPPKLVRRDQEFGLLLRRYRDSLGKGLPHHQLLTGGIGSGKTVLAKRIADELARGPRLHDLTTLPIYINCWRRATDRTVLLELLRGVGVSLPDRGYSQSEMLDVLEQGIRKAPRHLFIILDEVSALVRQETKLVYLLSRPSEVRLGSVSLFLVAPEDVLPYLDAASRSSFGVTHRLQLAKYDRAAIVDILRYRAELGLRGGTFSDEVLDQVARTAAGSGDVRFALEILLGAARLADAAGAGEIEPEHVRAARGSIYPTVTESKLEELPVQSLLVLLAVARSLKGPRTTAPTERVRKLYGGLAEEYGTKAVSRVTFWRTVKELEREGLLATEPGREGESARLSMDEVPASFLATLLESRAGESAPAKR